MRRLALATVAALAGATPAAADAAVLWPTARAGGAQGDGDTAAVALSPDGLLAAFSSDATNLVGGTTAHRSVYVRGPGAGKHGPLALISRRSAGQPANNDADESQEANGLGLDFSADGRYVVFDSMASNLVAGVSDANNASDVFRLDRVTHKLVLVSVARTGHKASDGGSRQARISGDGRFVVFQSSSKDLVAASNGGHVPQIYLRDMVTGRTTRVSLEQDQKTPANPFAEHPDISADGRYIVFASDDPKIANGDPNAVRDVFRRTVATGATVLVTKPMKGGSDAGPSDFPTISGDGHAVTFESDSKLVPGDANNQRDVYVANLANHTQRIASRTAGNAQINGPSRRPWISADGQRVAFVTPADAVVPGDGNALDDVFVRDLGARTTTWASQGAGDAATFPTISGNGRSVAFLVAGGGHLDNGDGNAKTDGYVRVLAHPSDSRKPTIAFAGAFAVLGADRSGIALVTVAGHPVRPDAHRRVRVHAGQVVHVVDGAGLTASRRR